MERVFLNACVFSVRVVGHHVQQSAGGGCGSQIALDPWRDGGLLSELV